MLFAFINSLLDNVPGRDDIEKYTHYSGSKKQCFRTFREALLWMIEKEPYKSRKQVSFKEEVTEHEIPARPCKPITRANSSTINLPPPAPFVPPARDRDSESVGSSGRSSPVKKGPRILAPSRSVKVADAYGQDFEEVLAPSPVPSRAASPVKIASRAPSPVKIASRAPSPIKLTSTEWVEVQAAAPTDEHLPWGGDRAEAVVLPVPSKPTCYARCTAADYR